MGSQIRTGDGSTALAELQEFASFTPAAQRYIRRSLDVAYERTDALTLWSRDRMESASIKTQKRMYRDLHALRPMVPDNSSVDGVGEFIAGVITLAAFDLSQQKLRSFGAFRFLYERLLGAAARPWLPAVYCGASSLPHLHPVQRRELLQSISEAAATAPGWSNLEPGFFPEFIADDVAL
jgi:hypothetical protein